MIAAGALSLWLFAPAALAQTAGDRVRITTEAGTLEGTLVDRLPDGYLVRFADGNRRVPYADVKSIVKVDAAASAKPVATPPPTPPAAPTAEPSGPQPTVVVLTPEPPAPPGSYYAPGSVLVDPLPPRRYRGPRNGLIAGGTTLLGLGILGLLTGAVLSPVGHAIKSANTCHDPSDTRRFDCVYGNGGSLAIAGDVTLIVGALVTGGGIAMIVGGSTSRSYVARRLPSVTVAPRGAALTWTF